LIGLGLYKNASLTRNVEIARISLTYCCDILPSLPSLFCYFPIGPYFTLPPRGIHSYTQYVTPNIQYRSGARKHLQTIVLENCYESFMQGLVQMHRFKLGLVLMSYLAVNVLFMHIFGYNKYISQIRSFPAPTYSSSKTPYYTNMTFPKGVLVIYEIGILCT